MRITLENTTKLVELIVDGAPVPARIWEGHTESGIPIHCYITRVAVHESLNQTQFERELQEQRTPSTDVLAIPMRLIL